MVMLSNAKANDSLGGTRLLRHLNGAVPRTAAAALVVMDDSSTVFVVDDDSAAREFALSLVRSKGFQAMGFASTEDFLPEYSPAKKGCVLVDVRMAGMAGLQLLENLRSPQGSLPVIATTSDGVCLAVKAM